MDLLQTGSGIQPAKLKRVGGWAQMNNAALATARFSLPTAEYLSKATEKYVTVLSELTPRPILNIQAIARFHYLKLHPVSGKPMIKELVNILYDQLAEFCLKSSRLESANYSHEHLALHREACTLLRKHKTGGEAGEILAYFLIESVLGAPQLVAKMELKTSTRVESLGADGLHFRWNEDDCALDIICAESKLERTASSAVTNLVTSLESFHKNEDYENELRLATAHFKHSDEVMKDAVMRVIRGEEPNAVYRIRHACLVGYNWNGYAGLVGSDLRAMEKQLRERYATSQAKLQNLIQTHFPRAVKAAGTLVAFDIFFLPFESVQDFRDAFNEAVG